MRVVIAVFAATLLLTGCKKMVGPAAPETPTAAEATAAAPTGASAADAAATGDAAAAPMDAAATDAVTGEVTGDRGGNGDRGNREGNGDRGNRGNDDREGDVVPQAPNR